MREKYIRGADINDMVYIYFLSRNISYFSLHFLNERTQQCRWYAWDWTMHYLTNLELKFRPYLKFSLILHILIQSYSLLISELANVSYTSVPYYLVTITVNIYCFQDEGTGPCPKTSKIMNLTVTVTLNLYWDRFVSHLARI